MRQGFVKTENYARFTAGVKAVEERGAAEAGMMLVHGQPGLGKSHIVYRWAEEAGAIFLRANVDWTPKYFLVELAKALNLDTRGTAQALFEQCNPFDDPTKYRKDSRGAYVPVEAIREIDLARDDLVREKAAKIEAMQGQLRALRDELMGDIAAFVELSAERYGAKLGGDKGNITLMSFDGEWKLKRQTSENIGFDEGLRAAKALIDECLEEWSRDSPSALRAIVEQAFNVNKEGRINTNAILSLRRHNIEDERWQRAMQAISDSLTVQDSKAYVRLYKRASDGRYVAVPLDMSAL